MANSFPPDVVVLDGQSLIHARFQHTRKNPELTHLTTHRLAEGIFTNAVVSPSIANRTALKDAVRRIKMESGKLDRTSILLPDSWFRIHLSEVEDLPEGKDEADEVVRWTLRRSLPMRPEDLRLAYQAISRSNGSVKVLVLAAIEKTLKEIEEAFGEHDIDVSLIEPIGLNIWNAINVREQPTTGDRLFFYFRPTDFTTAVFRGPTPLFIRSRNLSGERTLLQEIRLSASYLRGNLQWDKVEQCFVAGNDIDESLPEAIAQEFSSTVKRISLKDFADWPRGIAVGGYEAELAACTGVFTT